MKSWKKNCVIAMAVIILMSVSGSFQVHAAKKKLNVNKVYDTTTKVKGKTFKRALIKIKIGKKIYKTKANSKGNYAIKIPKQKVGKSFYVRAYKKKGKKWKLYTKKKIYVYTKTIVVKPFSKNDSVIQGYSKPNVTIGMTIIPKSAEGEYMDLSVASLETDNQGRFCMEWGQKIGESIVKISAYQKNKEFCSKKIRPYDL